MRKLFFAALTLLLTLGGGAVWVWAQQNEEVAPQLIAVQPYPGEEMPLDAPLTLIFNQAMNQGTVEAAWSLDPAVEGTFNWTADDTLVFTPADGWTRETAYTLTIGQTAAAVNGLTLADPYKATLRTVGRLLVNSIIPSNDAQDVAADATITVAFNRPVVALVSTEEMGDLPNPISIEPEVSGKGEWLNTSIYQFDPDAPLQGGTTYVVTVNAGLTDITGAVLEDNFVSTFQTLVPEILSTSPYDNQVVPLEQTIQISFSQPMDKASVEASFRLSNDLPPFGGESIPGEFSWSDDGMYLTFTPAENLVIDTSYRLTIDANIAKGIGGAGLRQGRDFFFRTVPLPFVAYTYPGNGETNVSPGYNSVTIGFGSPMNTDTFEGKYIISPEPAEVTPYVYSNTELSLQFEFMENTQYTITLKAGTEDVYGNAIASDYSFSFTTGSVEPYAYLVDAGNFVVTGAYRQNTALSISVSGKPTVTFELYEVPVDRMRDAFYYLYGDTLNAVINDSTLLRRWDETFDPGTAYAIDKVNLAEDGGVLPTGNYLLVGYFFQAGYSNIMPVPMAVVNNNVTVKRMENEVMVWVTDMQTGEPVVEQQVTVYSNGQPAARGATGADGVLRLNLETSDFITVTAEGADRYGIWRSNGAPHTPKTSMYVYTDRPIYRPAETLYFRGVYRERDDFTYTLSDLDSLEIIITDFNGVELLRQNVELTEFGTFSGEVLLPEDVAVGPVNIQVYTGEIWAGSASAQVAEFRVPEFSVTVTPEQDEIIGGDPLRAVINSTYFSGGAVSNAPVTWTAMAVQATFPYRGPGRYSFSDTPYFFSYEYDYYYGYKGYYSRTLASGSGITDASGNLLVEIPNTAPEGPYPERVTIEATINDESGQYISGRTTLLIHPGEVYVGIRTDQYFGEAEKPFTAEVITVNPQSETVPNQKVTLTLIEKRWEREPIEGQFGQYNWTQRDIEVETVDVTTDENGVASHEFTPPNAGIFMVRASTRDQRERLHQSSKQLWVTGSQYVWWGRPSNTIDLIADKDSYVAGDTAQILVPVSLEGVSYVLVTLERDGVVSHEVVRVEGSTLVYEVPITAEHEPGIFVSVTVMHGIDEANNVPTFRTGTKKLMVEPVSKRLNVTITPSTTNAQPGDTVTLDIEVTDPDGNPAQAEFGLALVDAAILSLASPNSSLPEAHFYGSVSNYTNTDVMLIALVDGRIDDTFGEERDREEAADGAAANDFSTPTAAPTATAELAQTGGGGGGGGFEAVEVREDFQQTPLWAAHVVTDENGNAQVSVTMPDNLTIWNLDARAFTIDTLVGDAELDIASTLPLLVRPSTPRFFVVGDEVSLAMVINNNTDEVQNVRATMQGSGYELMDGESLEQTVEIQPNSRARLEWNARILDVTAVDLTFIAIGNEGYQDASKPPLATGEDGTIPVYRYTAPDTVGTGGVLREEGSRTEGISIPPIADTDQGTLTIQLDPSLAVTTIDALDYLENYPHQCIEQTVSRFLPNVATYRALKSLGVDDATLEANLREELDYGLAKLKAEQNFDGGWGWFVSMESNPTVTAYAALGLIEAREAGYDIDVNMIDAAVSYLRTQLINPTEDTQFWMLNRQAFYLYVFSRDSRYAPSPAELDALFRVRLEMSQYAKAFLLMAYTAQDGDYASQIDSLTSDLITTAFVSATGAHWEEEFRDWWNWGSDTRTTAIVLSALIEAQPDNELLPNAVRWLMVARQGDHWETTQETAWAVIGLTDWMVATNELKGNYDYALILNSEAQTSGTVTPDTVREGQELVIAVGDLLLDEINRVTVTRGGGEGALYYTAHLRLRLDASEVDALDRGVSITREYFSQAETDPVTEAQVGDILTVRLTVTIPETIYYFVLEDPLPAGVEAMDTSLLTTTQFIEGPQIRPQYNPYYYWWWWYWDHTEIRDESVNLYADVLPPGTYVYSYQVRATVPGKFQTMPSHGYAFYFPEVFGRSDGELFVVKPSE